MDTVDISNKPMEIVKIFLSGLYDSNLAVEFSDSTWMRISRKKDSRFMWYNSNSPHQTLYFENHEQCYRIFELSIKPENIVEIVFNDSKTGNMKVYEKEPIELEVAKTLLSIK